MDNKEAYIANTNESWGQTSSLSGEGATNAVDDYLGQLLSSDDQSRDGGEEIIRYDYDDAPDL